MSRMTKENRSKLTANCAKLFFGLVLFGSGTAASSPHAHADCLDEVKALYANELDGYKRPPYRATRIHYDENGGKKVGYDDVVETPLKTVSLIHGGEATLAVGQDSWTGPSLTGPWTKAPNRFTDDRRETHRKQLEQSIKNMSNAVCGGEVELDGKTYLHYRYTTKTDPDPAMGGFWFGATEDVNLDPKTKLVMRWDMTDFVSSFAPNASKERSTATFVYDDTIEVTAPE